MLFTKVAVNILNCSFLVVSSSFQTQLFHTTLKNVPIFTCPERESVTEMLHHNVARQLKRI